MFYIIVNQLLVSEIPVDHTVDFWYTIKVNFKPTETRNPNFL